MTETPIPGTTALVGRGLAPGNVLAATAIVGRGLAPGGGSGNAPAATLYRAPVFDLKIRAQKRNPFSLAESNERAKEFFALGFFDPARAPEALGALEMMEFEGKDAVEAYIRRRAGGGA